jgi:[ribosomal protein S5]-alanine N-acetyltransferase
MKHFLETRRLKLIPFSSNDFDLLHRTFTDAFVRKYLWDGNIIPVEKTKEVLLISEQQFESNGWGLWKIIVKSDDTYVGFVGLWIFFNETQPQLLYGLLPDQTRFGYATESSKAIIEYAFNTLKFDYLIAACDALHKDSKKVCERLKMKVIDEKEMDEKLTTFYRVNKETYYRPRH